MSNQVVQLDNMRKIELKRPIEAEFWQDIANYAQTNSHWAVAHIPNQGTFFQSQNDSLLLMVELKYGKREDRL